MKKTLVALSLILLSIVLLSACARGGTPPPNPAPAALGDDPTKETILIGKAEGKEMIVVLELEPAKSMWMLMGGTWMEMKVAAGELYHVEVKPTDPGSGTRLSYALVKFKAVNKDKGQTTEGELSPMWGGSGLHYAFNSGLSGDGLYEATITVEAPTFGRALSDKDKWMKPTVAQFTFRLKGGLVVEKAVIGIR